MTTSIDLELFINHLKTAVVIVDHDGQFVHKNAVFDALFSRAGHVAERDLYVLFEQNPIIIDCVKKVAEIKGNYFLRQIPVIFFDGSCASMDIEVFPIMSRTGDILYISLIFSDRSESIHFEEHQRRMDRVHYLGTIASGLAHEIKNPLSGIKGASQLLAKSLQPDSDLKQCAEIIQKEVVRVDNLLKELLHFTRPKVLNKKPANINQLLHDVVFLQKTVEPERVIFEEDYDPSLPEIRVDADAISQVILNLLKNGRQSIKDRGRIKVRSRIITDYVFRKEDRTRQVICVEVQDTGTGIDPETLTKIFTPFYTTKAKGTGLGLALCHQIIEEHEGHIRVKSQVDRGTIFSLYLPI